MQFQKISLPPPPPPHRRDYNLGGGYETKTFKEMYGAFLEFPEGWGGFRQNPFHEGGLDIFWNYTLLQKIDGLGFNLLQCTQVILIFSFCIKIC